MRIRKFTGDNYSEVLAKVKKELGSDTLILNTRSIRGESESGELEGSTQVEIITAIDSPPVRDVASAEQKIEQDFPSVGEPFGNEADDPCLKSMIFTLLGQTERARSMGLQSHQLEMYSQLVQRGVNERLACKVIEKACDKNGGKNSAAGPDKRQVAELMKRILNCGGAIQLNKNSPRKVVLVGPTGVGKTTTIAKIAADFTFRQGKKVALISLDTYRIGAIEQLRIYGEIMRVPVDIVTDRQSFRDVVYKHSDCDLILIDTMGRGNKDLTYSGLLGEIFKGMGEIETHLVLEMTAREEIFNASCKQFAPLGIDRVLFTKLDEGPDFGSMFNFAVKTRIPFSYLTMGQRVPEDIEVADKDKVISLIFN